MLVTSFLPSTSHVYLPLSPLRIGWTIFSYLNFTDQVNARGICKKWKRWIDNVHLVENYRKRLMTPLEVRREATYYLQKPEQLLANQRLLLAMVKLSIHCKQMQAAAANALMILKKTRFCFIGTDLRDIQAPGVRLPRTLLDKVNFARANLREADFSDCSLNHAIFDGANLKDTQWGQLPYLKHTDGDVRTMALAPNNLQLASMDKSSLYLWNLETFEFHSHPLAVSSFCHSHLLFSHDGQWLFHAYEQGKIEIWQCHPLTKVFKLRLKNSRLFTFLALTPDNTHLISVAKYKSQIGEIRIWRLQFDQAKLPSLALHQKRSMQAYSIQCSFASQSSLLIFGIRDRQQIRIEYYTFPNLAKIQTIPLWYGSRSEIERILLTPQGHAFLVAGTDVSLQPIASEVGRAIHLWDEKAKKFHFLFAEDEKIIHWQFLPNSQRLAYLTEAGTFCIRDGAKHYQLEVREKIASYPIRFYQHLWWNETYCYHMAGNKIMVMPLRKLTIRKAKGLNAEMQTACFSNNEQTFYAVDCQGKIYAYQTATGKELFCKPLKTGISQDFSPYKLFRLSDDGKCVLNSIECKWDWIYHMLSLRNLPNLKLFHLQGQKEVWNLRQRYSACALSPRGDYVVLAHPQGLGIWHTTSQKELGFVPLPLHASVSHLILSSTVFPQALIVTCENHNDEHPTKVWEVEWEKRSAHLIATCAAIRDGRFIAEKCLILQQSDKLVIWHPFSHRKEHILCMQYPLSGMDITCDGSLMVTAESAQEPDHTYISLWDLKKKAILDKQFFPFVSSWPPRSVYLSPQGRYVICWGLNRGLRQMYAWQIKKGKLHLAWKISKQLEANNISLKNVQHLSRNNTQLFAQRQNEG